MRVNGRVVRVLGAVVQERDRVDVDGAPVRPPDEHTYLLLHKPIGVVTTMSDPQGRRTVAELVSQRRRVVPVGRLDYATSGVLLLSDDGELANRLLHPRFGVEKTYRVTIAGRLLPDDVRQLNQGMDLGEYRAAGAKLRIIAGKPDQTVVEITIHEGRNRQVRRMFEALGHRVVRLVRTRFGPLRLGALAPGEARQLTPRERAALERHRRHAAEFSRTNPDTKNAAK